VKSFIAMQLENFACLADRFRLQLVHWFDLRGAKLHHQSHSGVKCIATFLLLFVIGHWRVWTLIWAFSVSKYLVSF
jgi:hypothetical protein